MSDITQILSALEQGDPRAAEQLLPLVYDDLRNWRRKGWPAKRCYRPCSRPPWFTRRI